MPSWLVIYTFLVERNTQQSRSQAFGLVRNEEETEVVSNITERGPCGSEILSCPETQTSKGGQFCLFNPLLSWLNLHIDWLPSKWVEILRLYCPDESRLSTDISTDLDEAIHCNPCGGWGMLPCIIHTFPWQRDQCLMIRHGRTQGAWALCGTHGEKLWVIKRCHGCLRLRTLVAVWFGLVGEYEGMGWTETKGQRNLNHVRSWRMSGGHQVALNRQ